MLLSGLPGDAESETAYRDQFQAWVDLSSANPRAAQVLGFCDAPDAVQVPSGGKVKILKNDRKTFLEMAKEAVSKTNALVVIAWGHGGRQGANPVLHVRGPRLTPDDFLLLAPEAATSRWILLFRGSGAFARRLAGPSAQMISSDVDQSFASDPVGMPLLLKLARGPDSASFEDLAKAFGRATAAWYEERSLARTEEPAWWNNGDKPQLLAAATEVALADKPPTAPPKAEQDSKEPTKQEPSSAKQGSPPGAAWSRIRKVDPAAYPDHDAVILEQRLICRLGSDPALATEQEEFIQVLTPEGKTLGDFDISFSPPAEEIEFQDCEVLRPDGQVARLETDRIDEASERPPGDYQGERRKFFSLPGVVPGAVIHVRYNTRWKKFPLPQVSMALPIGKNIPALRSALQVSVPKQSAFHWTFERINPPDPVIQSSAYAVTYSWQFTNLPAQKRELLGPPRSEARLLFSTFQDWSGFAEWYSRISRLTAEATPEIAEKARALTADARNNRERLLALYNYVTALRYVAVPLGINSVRPHAAANVLQNQFGDCKDKANLLNAMLRALDIDAHLVLVPRFSQAYDAVPGLAFNHAISRVKLGSDILWLDTTDDVCRFGMLPPGDYGRKVLVIDDESKSLTELPVANPADHRLEIDGQIAWSSEGDSLPVSLKAAGFGYADYELRAAQRELSHVSIPLLAARLRPAAGSFALDKQEATPVSALDQDFTWKGEGALIGLCSGKGTSRAMHSPFWIPKEWDLALHRRQGPMLLGQGYPLKLSQNFEIQLGSRPASVDLPRECESSDGPLRWKVEWVKISDDRLGARLKAQLEGGEFSTAQTLVFQKQLRAFLDAVADDATITLSK